MTHPNLSLYWCHKETIFVADGGHDYRAQCELSGEPVITTMAPEEDAHESELSEPFVKSLVGEPEHRSAYDVRPVLLVS